MSNSKFQMPKNKVRIGEFIQDYRDKNRLTCCAFAKRLGITHVAIVYYELEMRLPTIAICRKLAKELDMSLMDIIEMVPDSLHDIKD